MKEKWPLLTDRDRDWARIFTMQFYYDDCGRTTGSPRTYGEDRRHWFLKHGFTNYEYAYFRTLFHSRD